MAKQVKKRESSAQNADDSRASARGGNRRAGRDYRDGSEDGNSAPRRDAPPEGQPPEQIAMETLLKKEVFQIRLDCELPARSICLVKNPSQPASIAARELEKMLRQK